MWIRSKPLLTSPSIPPETDRSLEGLVPSNGYNPFKNLRSFFAKRFKNGSKLTVRYLRIANITEIGQLKERTTFYKRCKITMKPAFLVWLSFSKNQANRVKKQYSHNLPKGIV